MSQIKEYIVEIKTEDEWRDSSTKSNILIQLVGERRESDWEVLNEKDKSLFQQGNVAQFKISCENLGPLLLIRIKLDHEGAATDNWSAETITIKHDSNKEDLFPLYEFVTDYVEVANAKYNLPHKLTHEVLQQQRKNEIEKNKKKYTWTTDEAARGMPKYMDAKEISQLPKELHMKDMFAGYFLLNAKYTRELVGIELKENAQIPWNNLDVYKELFSHDKIDGKLAKSIEESWDKDEEFGRQMLNGINPTVVKRCTELPKECNITYEHVEGLIPDHSLNFAISNKRLFVINHFETSKGVDRNVTMKTVQLFAADPLCLFYAFEDGTFRPIAIQLKADDPESIFTPKDKKYDWMLAKMHFRCSDIGHYEWVTHLLNTHLSIEPVSVALYRCLPRSHPVYKLLRPHVRTVQAINLFARSTLINPKLQFQQMVSISGAGLAINRFNGGYSFTDLDIPKVLRENDTMCEKVLKNYHYRDDALKVWEIVTDYVDDVIRHFYDSNEEVKNDFELQDWIHEIAMEGFASDDGNTRDVPTSFDSIDQLIWFCTLVIFTSSAQHASVNFGQFDILKFIPNAPLGLREPFHKRGEGSIEKIMKTLPDVFNSVLQIGLTAQLSAFSPNEVYLGEFPDKLFIEGQIGKLQEKMRKKLSKFSEEVDKRNKDLKCPYEYLKPEKIPASTAI